jgi:hypothetical protein
MDSDPDVAKHRHRGTTLVVAALMVALEACGTTVPRASVVATRWSPSLAPGTPIGAPASVAPTPFPGSTQSPVGAVDVVPCRPDAASLSVVFPPPLPAPVPIPATLPAGLPGELVPAGASVYGIGVPGDVSIGKPAWYFYAVGPPGLACRVGLGNYIDVELTGPAQAARIYLDFPGSEGPSQLLACRYIAAARAAAAPFATPGDCTPGPADQVTALTTASPQDHVGLVSTPAADGADPTLALYAFTEAGGGESAKIECRLPPSERSTCLASFAFFVTQLTFGSTPPAQVTTQLADLLR